MDRAETVHGDSRGGTGVARVGIAALLVGCLVLLVPVLIAPVPPLADYPNHLARLWLLSSADAQRAMADFYQVDLDTYTNIAIDLVALTLGKLAGYEVAGRFSIGLAVLLPFMGGALLWWSVHRRLSWWMASFGLLAWGSTLLSGFLNFQIAIGLALLSAAGEAFLVDRAKGVQLVTRAILSVLLLLAHPFGLLLYALLLGALAIGPSPRFSAWRSIVGRLLLPAVSIGVVLILYLGLVPSLPGSEEQSGVGTLSAELAKGFATLQNHKTRKIANLLFAIRSYNNLLDGATLAVLLLAPALALWRRELQVHVGLLLLSIGLAIAYFICPDYLTGASWVDVRFAVMAPFVLAASLYPALPQATGRLCAGLLLLMFAGRTAVVGSIWSARQADVAAVADAVSSVPAGSAIMPLEHRAADRSAAPWGRYSPSGESSYRHLPALTVPWRHAFIPNLFAARGKQPIVTLPPWQALSEPNGGMLADIHALDPVMPEGMDTSYTRYAPDWRRFDYLLVVNADVPDEYGPLQIPGGVELVRDTGFAKLFKISH